MKYSVIQIMIAYIAFNDMFFLLQNPKKNTVNIINLEFHFINTMLYNIAGICLHNLLQPLNLHERIGGRLMYFTEKKVNRLLEELSSYIYSDSEKITAYKMKTGDFKGGEDVSLDDSSWSSYEEGMKWGGRDVTCWFRTQFGVPAKYAGKTLVYEVKTGREGQWDAVNPQFIVYVNGRLIQGLDVNHRHIVLAEEAKEDDIYNIALHAYSGMHETMVELSSSISVLNKEVEKLYFDLKVPHDIAALLEVEDKKRIDILNYVNEAFNIIDFRKPFSKEFYASVKASINYIETEFYGKYCGCEDVTVQAVGHTHIDVAWLWTLGQTRKKAARSFSTVLNLMKQYPEYIFMSSQPQLYKFIKEDYPELYEEIKERVKEGRWEPEGAMWLEADCNLSSGESLVRQVLFGTRFFENEFGVKNKILWLPDVFGYSAALPQILKKSGIDYFMTTKISWNEYNKLPYDTFMWKGIDGTEILTHFITSERYQDVSKDHRTTYNSDLSPSEVMGSWLRYQQKDLNNEVLVCYGYGDGGGGPTKEMLEYARRMEKGIPGSPKVKLGNSLDFFRKLEKKASGKKRLPKWVGELYLEYHRGTYTSMARNKKFNRKSEFLYQDAELLSVINSYAAGNGQYPQNRINAGWETVLLNQFHDILPGSSIKEVYEESKKQYLDILDKGRILTESAIAGITGKINTKETSVVVFNQLSFDRSDVVTFELPDGFENVEVYDCNGRSMPVQTDNSGKQGRRALFFAEKIPAKGYKSFILRKTAANTSSTQSALKAEKEGLSNRFFDIKLDDNANITSIYDKINNREVLQANKRANVIQAFEDKPITFDAWDINIYYQEKMWEVNDVESIELVENGPVRSCVKIRRRFLDSTIDQNIYVYNDIPRIDFENVIDWKEKQILLKAAFPVDVHADKASYEIQYGNVERATHWNTSWDYAKFEVCAHKWADLSEDGYGISLMNDCKYGHDIKDGVMRLTLLKSAILPNVDADREVHEFTYSLYPHAGNWRDAGTVHMAYALNCPMYVKVEEAHEGSLPSEFSLVRLDSDNVVVEVVKKAEDSDDVIIRLYECYNRRTNVELTFFKKLSEVWECDMLENGIETVNVEGNGFKFHIKPYEIKTFKLKI